MKTKRFLLAVLAVALICALSVAGTMALLKQQANEGAAVTNTFQAYTGGGTGKPLASTFELKEYEVEKNTDGSYKFKEVAVEGGAENQKEKVKVTDNSYKVMPGMTLPKDAFVTIASKTDAPAYLFLEVKDELDAKITWTLESDWKAVMENDVQMTGNNGGNLYYYKDILAGSSADKDYPIIANDVVSIANDAELGTGDMKLTFYAYLAQATVNTASGNSNDPATVYTACFPTTTPDGDGEGNA